MADPQAEKEAIRAALHTALWREGFHLSERLERCTGQDARAVSEVLVPVVERLIAEHDASRDAKIKAAPAPNTPPGTEDGGSRG